MKTRLAAVAALCLCVWLAPIADAHARDDADASVVSYANFDAEASIETRFLVVE